MKKILNLCLLIAVTLTVSAKNLKEFVVTTQPQMTCQNCENKIKKNLRFEKGVTNITTDLANQVVVVSYDADKTDEAKLTEAFAKLDYQVKPTTKAEGCKKAEAKECCKKSEGCKKAEAKECCKKAEGCKKAEAKECCKKAEGCKKADAKECCKKAEGCKKADAKECCKKAQ